MNARKLTALIDDSYTSLYLLCQRRQANEHGFDVQRALARALGMALAGERKHRRFMGEHGRYRVSRPTAAKYMVVHHVFRGPRPGQRAIQRKISWIEAATTRDDCVQCY